MQKAVIFGAGNVGRGFLGQLYSESGYEVTFVDIDERIINAMRARRSYTIRFVTNELTEDITVGPVTGLLSQEEGAVAERLVEATLAATAVGARVLKFIAPLIAAGVALRAQRAVETPLNIIVCENLKDAAHILYDLVLEHLDPQYADYLDQHVGFVETVIARMVPELPAELREQDPSLIIVEPYKELPVDRRGFVGQKPGDIAAEIPTVVGMTAYDDFGFFTARKLYLHNAAHAILGYLGYLRGHEYGYTALDDPEIRPILDGALRESMTGVASEFGVPLDVLGEHVADLAARFANRVLADPVLRLARDPLRKLAPSDRLVGAARLAVAAGVSPENLAWGIAAALRFDAATDGRAAEMQARIAGEGVEAVLASVCEIDAGGPLGLLVLDRYERLGQEPRWAQRAPSPAQA